MKNAAGICFSSARKFRCRSVGRKVADMQIVRSPQSVVALLSRSPFRRKFRLSPADRAVVREYGMRGMMEEARALVAEQLAPAAPQNDGRQTPFRGHPIFAAQHGTATCCRRCLEKWHHIATGRALTLADQDYILAVIMTWIETNVRPHAIGRVPPSASASA